MHKKDFDILNYNAAVAHKLPVFAIQFIQSNEVYLLVKPDLLQEVAQYIETGEYTDKNSFVGIDLSEHEDMTTTKNRVIKSSSRAREQFNKEKENRFKKEKRSAT